MLPPRGLGVAGASGGRPHREERRKASLCFPTTGGPYVVCTYGQCLDKNISPCFTLLSFPYPDAPTFCCMIPGNVL